MKKVVPVITAICLTILVGCQPSVPTNLFKPAQNALALRTMQSRSFDTTSENKIIQASAAALQDMGFMIDESETRLGLIVASKKADASSKLQTGLYVAGAVLGVLGGTYNHNDYGKLDDIQKVNVSLVTHVIPSKGKTTVRITFQRVVWNKNKEINRVETIQDPKLYENFFSTISKALFLEEHQI